MKVLVLTVLCAVAGGVAGGSVAWPGAAVLSAPLLNTVIPAQTKAFGYSTTQYLNTLPVSYTSALGPQFAYHVPQLSGISAFPQAAYYPVTGLTSSIQYPGSTIFYPSGAGVASFAPSDSVASAPPAPAPPSSPSSPPSFSPEQPKGDADTAVIESADAPSEPQQQQMMESDVSGQQQPSAPQFPPASTFPNFPQFPQGSGQIPSFPQIPQFPQGSVPSFPPLPQIPSNPLFPQGPPSSPPSSFPGAPSSDQGLNDEDTIAVESA